MHGPAVAESVVSSMLECFGDRLGTSTNVVTTLVELPDRHAG
jgi:hypothetical protein